MCICWELWKCRNAGRYEGLKQSADYSINSVDKSIGAVLVNSGGVDKSVHKDVALLNGWGLKGEIIKPPKILVLKWKMPASGRLKLNSDGRAKGNPGLSGGGCILRDSEGNVRWAVAAFYVVQSNMVAEARAMLCGIRKCREEGIVQVDVEADSLILVQILNGSWKVLGVLFMKLEN